jgi:hypothetical protein
MKLLSPTAYIGIEKLEVQKEGECPPLPPREIPP